MHRVRVKVLIPQRHLEVQVIHSAIVEVRQARRTSYHARFRCRPAELQDTQWNAAAVRNAQ